MFSDTVIRYFAFKKHGQKDSRKIRHFQFIAWPDKGVPRFATAILSFRRRVRKETPRNTGPIVVHCSAGVGRTGTYIVIDAMLERIKTSGDLDIYNYLKGIRNQRISMVQTKEQYEFIHTALLESITCGLTEFSIENLGKVLSKLRSGGARNEDPFREEYKRLAYVSPSINPIDCSEALRNENQHKCRDVNSVPMNSSRVMLHTSGNFICASFVDTYRERSSFVLTQAPLESTMTDFWVMVHQYKCGTVVMLNELNEKNKGYPQYWPATQAKTPYGPVQVEFTSEEQEENITVRKFAVSKVKGSDRMEVQHFQYHGWAENGLPKKEQSLLKLLSMVQKSQQQSVSNKVVVQCSNGYGRSGTFCSIYSIIERLNTEQMIDVFQAVKLTRIAVPKAVETEEQYKFCYEILRSYLDQFSVYSNFTR